MIRVVQTSVFEKWLDKLKSKKTRAIISDHIDRMRVGNLGDTRNVGSGIFEKKINYAHGFRLYYYFMLENKIILLCGGDKSTQQKDIVKAKEIKKGL